ncbi:MAG: T9SS type A sorting domain-containing protein [Flavobacteriales bacterium]|nr:T9SS type A sorting domain-containing protein [Flavobacteriales bacterium]
MVLKNTLFYILTFISWVFQLNAQNYCLRFRGNGSGDIDRIKIPIDDPENKVDIGQSFTIEFFIRALLSENPLGISAVSGNNDDWTLGHTIIDRDIFGAGDYGDYGISLANGRIAFGVNNGTDSYTLIGNTFVANNVWHHIAVTRNHITGEMSIFMDGILDVSYVSNVTGNISYRNNRPTAWPNDPYLIIGAEKHDYDNTQYPSYSGYFDEFRISNTIRYTTNFTPATRFIDDAQTILLYHFDEGVGNIIQDSAIYIGTTVPAIRMYGGNPAGPDWVLRDSLQITGIDNNKIHEFFQLNLFPNPANDVVQVYVSEPVIMECYDLTGRCIEKFHLNKGINNINVMSWPMGVYYFHTSIGPSQHVKLLKR